MMGEPPALPPMLTGRRTAMARAARRDRGRMKILDELEQAWSEHFHLWPRAQLSDEFEAITGRRLTPRQLDRIGSYMDLRGAPNVEAVRCRERSRTTRAARAGARPDRSARGSARATSRRTPSPMYSERFTGGRVEIKVPGASPYEAFTQDRRASAIPLDRQGAVAVDAGERPRARRPCRHHAGRRPAQPRADEPPLRAPGRARAAEPAPLRQAGRRGARTGPEGRRGTGCPGAAKEHEMNLTATLLAIYALVGAAVVVARTRAERRRNRQGD